MSVEDNVQDLIHDAKVRKEGWVAEHPEQPDQPTMVMVYRDGEMVAQSFAMPDRDKMLQATSILCFGCNANEVVMVFEAYGSDLKDNPITQEPWGPEEMAFIATEHDGIKKGWVNEALNLMAYDRSGNHLMVSLIFTIEDGKVDWGEEKIKILNPNNEADSVKFDGYVHQNMLSIMAGPTMADKAREDLGEEGFQQLKEQLGTDGFIASDIATVKFILKAGVAMAAGLCAPKDSERSKRIEVMMREAMEKDDGFDAIFPEDN